jgi:Ca2+-binding RTX toxin-like protein
MWGDAGNDIMWGEVGNDSMYGDTGNDQIVGGVGNDQILGGAGNDQIEGGAGNDRIVGEAGNDIIWGEAGKDLLIGGLGQDQFSFDSKLGLSNIDIIADYKVGLGGDTLALDTIIFKSLAGITDVTKNFIVGSRALDSNDYLIFNPKTSVLSYDANGSGAGGAVSFVILTGIHALDSAEFSIYSS